MKTLRNFTFAIELLGIVLIILSAYFLLQNMKTLIIDNKIEEQKIKIEEINYFLDTNLEGRVAEFKRFYDNQKKEELVFYMDQFSDIYYVNQNMKIETILKQEERSLIFKGYDISMSKLGIFVRGLLTDKPTLSPMLKSSELDTISVYVGIKTSDRYLIGRIDLEKITNFLKVSAASQGSIIVIASKDGYVLSSTDKTLPFQTVPEFDSEKELMDDQYLVLKHQNDRLGNNLVILIPKEKALGLLGVVNGMFPLFLTVIIIVMLLKILAEEFLIIQPLENLSKSIGQWNFESRTSINYANVLNTNEIKMISNQFVQKSLEINNYIGEMNTAKADLEYVNQNLEKTVQERTEALTEAVDRLVQTEKLAALGSLVAGVAHEINTPIGVCITASTFLKAENIKIQEKIESNVLRRNDFDEFLDNVNEIMLILDTNLTRTADMVQSFKQIAVDQISDIRSTFSLKENIYMVMTSLKHEYKSRHVVFEVDCDESLVVNSYPGSFSQIFTNFIMNSLYHGFKDLPEGTVRIKCTQENDFLIIRYEDNGAGMQRANISKVFDPFFTTNRTSGNSGLGMTIVYNIINKLSGTIRCESEVGKGTAFILEIPWSQLEE